MNYRYYSDTDIKTATPILAISKSDLKSWLNGQSQVVKNWVNQNQYDIDTKGFCLIANHEGTIERVLVISDDLQNMWLIAHLPYKLPPGKYYIENYFEDHLLQQIVIGWGLGSYQFLKYKKQKKQAANLIVPKCCNHKTIQTVINAFKMGRDIINTSAEDFGPEQVAHLVSQISQQYHATVKQIVGDALVKKGYHAIYTVGKASRRLPRLIDLQWGDLRHPSLTLVGKGVCFDTGGLDIKSLAAMDLMRKDMGGAAHALALARMIMEDNLPVRLRLLIPAVDNAISDNAYRPGDVIKMRNGKTVEVYSTDAEGRLILADALTEASNTKPDLLIDFATLTGAARSALGFDIPAMFASKQKTANDVQNFAHLENDLIWQLPLHQPYWQMLESNAADFKNSSKVPYAGAITAALFLQQFVTDTMDWLHFDISAWNLYEKPGHPEGGELIGLRALFSYIRQRFSVQH
ncbi:MAG: leucyl aminopeptidase family protein [Pseudomonadota bacterium]